MFVDVAAPPVPSLLRNFSAPVIVKYDYSEAELTHLMAHDVNAFNRWEAGQRLALELILRSIEARRGGNSLATPQSFVRAFARVLADAPRDPAFGAEALALPARSTSPSRWTKSTRTPSMRRATLCAAIWRKP